MFKQLFKNLINTRTEKDIVEEYLADAADLIDLENRIRLIDRNEAPWQVRNKMNIGGWA